MSEKQQEAKKLLNEIISIETTSVLEYNDYFHRYYEVDVCKINGFLYVKYNALNHDMKNFVNTMKKKISISGSDFIHGHNKGRLCLFVRAAVLKGMQQEMIEYLQKCNLPDMKTSDCYVVFRAMDYKGEVIDNCYPDLVIDQSEASYNKRVRLITEAKNERLEAARDNVLKAEEKKEDTLEELVRKIEAMGWDVTLKLRKDDVA